MIDVHYSPVAVAEELAQLLPARSGMSIFDPAMGEGALLAASAARIGAGTTVMGADIDPGVVAGVSVRFPNWTVGRADATNRASRAASVPWRLARRHVDVVVMNPPFSFRGQGRHSVRYAAHVYRATPAVAFVATALSELRPRDGVFAVLPRGAIDGKQDRDLWASISMTHEVVVHRELPRGTFRGAAATSLMVSIRPSVSTVFETTPVAATERRISEATIGRRCACVEVVRGRVPISRLIDSTAVGLVPWIHTTDIKGGRAEIQLRRLPPGLGTSGPFVTLPRVGRFDSAKIAVIKRAETVVSDCLFALRVPAGDVRDLRNDLIARQDELARLYFGTGAPHITLERLISFLSQRGYLPRHVSADALSQSCWCMNEADGESSVAI